MALSSYGFPPYFLVYFFVVVACFLVLVVMYVYFNEKKEGGFSVIQTAVLTHDDFISAERFDSFCKGLFRLVDADNTWIAGRVEIWLDEKQGCNIGLFDLEGNLMSQLHVRGKVEKKDEKGCHKS